MELEYIDLETTGIRTRSGEFNCILSSEYITFQ